MEDPCTRPGSVPFKWEICPGTPKHTRSASAAAAARAPAAAKQLAPPPFMASPSPYSSPRVSYGAAARSASVSPSRRRHGGRAAQRRPTAFIELVPRAMATAAVADAHAETEAREAAAAANAYRCFPLRLLARRRRGGGGGGKKGRSGSASGSSSSGSSFRSSDGVGEPRLRRSASSSWSSLPLPPARRFAEAREEAEAAAGWFF